MLAVIKKKNSVFLSWPLRLQTYSNLKVKLIIIKLVFIFKSLVLTSGMCSGSGDSLANSNDCQDRSRSFLIFKYFININIRLYHI